MSTLCTSGFLDDVMFAHNGQAQATRIGRMLKLTYHGQHGGGRRLMSTLCHVTNCFDSYAAHVYRLAIAAAGAYTRTNVLDGS